MENIKQSYIEIQEQTSDQQMIINGQIIKSELKSYLGLCSNCKTILFNSPPGNSLSNFIIQLDQRVLKQGSFGYCPSCGYKLN